MYFVDTLYGEINLDIPRELLYSPELQRLREIRLCNINSPFITGGTSLNRFEHAIGTAYLAQEIMRYHTDDPHEQASFIIASLLHDIVTAPFGHSLEYLYELVSKKTYEHANIWKMIFTGQSIPSSRYFFAKKKVTLHRILDQNLLNTVQNILESKHLLSRLIISDIDIDNIDNVFRFGLHIGLSFDKSTALNLAKALRFNNNLIVVTQSEINYFETWFKIRHRLYKYLLEDSGEFAAKALLERSFIECLKGDLISEYDWVRTDSEMVAYILEQGNKKAKKCIQRLMLMDFPSLNEIYFAKDYTHIDKYLETNKLGIIDAAFDQGVFLHFIRDVNKTCRKMNIIIADGNKEVNIGHSDDRYLIGLFADTRSSLTSVKNLVKKELGVELFDSKESEENETQSSFF